MRPSFMATIGLVGLSLAAMLPAVAQPVECGSGSGPYLVVLGVGQDAGAPQAGTKSGAGFTDLSDRRLATSIGLIAPKTGSRWMFEATPDFRDQLYRLDQVFPVETAPGLEGVFLTHAHIGHYLGLAQLGHEVMGADAVPVYAMPRMAEFLSSNGPWDQLVRYENISLRVLTHQESIRLTDEIEVMPFLVPHRDEYSETVGFEIRGSDRTVVFLPDINKWEAWDTLGVRLETVVAGADLLFVDATFYADGELPGRDMSVIKHPFITETMERLAPLDAEERAKVYFIHLNHTNPALDPESAASREIEARGFHVAREGMCFTF